jgi:hypothetical protein
MTAKTKTSKAATKATAKHAATISGTAKVVNIKDRKQGGTKKKFHSLIPKKGGITVTALKAKAAKELHVKADKIEPWLRGFLRRGLIKVA